MVRLHCSRAKPWRIAVGCRARISIRHASALAAAMCVHDEAALAGNARARCLIVCADSDTCEVVAMLAGLDLLTHKGTGEEGEADCKRRAGAMSRLCHGGGIHH